MNLRRIVLTSLATICASFSLQTGFSSFQRPAQPSLRIRALHVTHADHHSSPKDANTNIIESGTLLVAPAHEYDHLLKEAVILLFEVDMTNIDRPVKGVIMQRPTAFSVGEMISSMGAFSSNTLMKGGEDGGGSVIMLHHHFQVEGARSMGSGLFVGGVALAEDLVATGELPADDFQFFFNHVSIGRNQLSTMLSRGGWRVSSFPEPSPAMHLKSRGYNLWKDLTKRLSQKTEAGGMEDGMFSI